MLDRAAIAAAQAGQNDGDDDGEGGGGTSLYQQFKITRKLKPPNYPIRNQVLQRLGTKFLRVGVASCQGKREDMEDAHITKLSLPKHPDCGLFGVFDGHNGPDAARWVAKHLHEFVDSVKVFDQDSLTQCLIDTDKAFLSADGINDNHGTTAVFAILENQGAACDKDSKKSAADGSSEEQDDKSDKGKDTEASNGKGKEKNDEPANDGTGAKQGMTGKWSATICNLGDSRCILGHYSKPDIVALTVDHKPTDEEEVKRIQEAGGHVTRKRVDGVLAVSRAIGDSTYKTDASLPPEKQKVIPVPVVTTCDITEDNFMFICCDGIFESFSNEEAIKYIHERLKKTNDLAKILSDLLTAVVDKGSQDNMTAMLIEFRDGSDYDQPDELVIGEWYERGNPGYELAFKNHCAYLGKDPEEVKQLWFEKKKKLDDPALAVEKLKVLRETFGTLEIGTEVLRMVLCSGENFKGKKRFGKTIS